MFLRDGICQSTKGDALPGYFVECVASNVAQAIYADANSTPIVSVSGVANRAKADVRGNYSYFVADGNYYEKYYDKQGVFQFQRGPFSMIGMDSVAEAAASAAAAAASAAASTNASNLTSGTVLAARMPALTGDVTTTVGTVATTIAGGAVTNAKLANVATATLKGRVTGGTGSPEDLTGTQATTLLDTFSSALKGLAPASGGGTTNFLRADGAWAAPPGDSGLRADLGGATGAGLVAFSHANAYAAATIGAKLKLFVNVKDAPYLAAGDGVADDSAAFQAALNDARAVFVPKGDYKINTPLVLPVTGATLASDEKARLFSTVNGKHIVSGVNVAGVTILGLRFEGANSATVPLAGFGGYAASTTGLVTLAGCSDVRVEGNEFNNFHNGLSVQNCDRLWVERNRARNFYVHGILASRSSDFAIERNFISGCTQAGGAAAYGIHATGDQAGGEAQLRGSISFNIIDGVPSWDGIMSHDCDGLRIVGNDIRNVRKGIDVGHLQATNVVKNVVIEGNLIVGTAANTWGAAGAETVGIAVAGYDAANRVDGVTVRGNIVRDFFGVAGMVGAGDPNGITVSNADSVCVSDNHVLGSGAVVNSAGIGIGGTVNNGLSLIGNNLQGSMGRGAIRLANVIAEAVVIVGNAMEQTVAATEGILITGSTITALQVNDNPTNSTAPFTQSTSVLTFTGQNLEAAVAYDPPNLVDGAGVTTTVAVAGAAVGDFAIASFGGDLAGMLLTAYVSAAGTVSVRFQNETGGALDLGNSTLRARVFKRLT